MQSCRKYIGTLNNPQDNAKDILQYFFERTKARYVCGQLEQGKSGTVHLQFFCLLQFKQRITSLTKIIQAHYQMVIKDNGASEYTMKVDTRLEGPWEFGQNEKKRGGDHKSKSYIQLKEELNTKEDWENLTPYQITIMDKANKIMEAKFLPNYDGSERRCYWIWGPSGSGKSKYAFQNYPDAYRKAQNKWWDGYHGQQTVIIDDLDSDSLGHYLKIWGDRYPAIGEIKGSSVNLNYKVLIVTSNHSISELFKNTPINIEPIQRRFISILADISVNEHWKREIEKNEYLN